MSGAKFFSSCFFVALNLTSRRQIPTYKDGPCAGIVEKGLKISLDGSECDRTEKNP